MPYDPTSRDELAQAFTEADPVTTDKSSESWITTGGAHRVDLGADDPAEQPIADADVHAPPDSPADDLRAHFHGEEA